MLYVLFNLDKDRYVIRAKDVIEIIPLVKLNHIPKTPDYVAGMFSYRGTVVPVIDMRRLTESRELRNVMSTRIILVNYMVDDSEDHVLGLIVEHATDTVSLNEDDFSESAVHVKDSPYMTKVVTDEAGVIQGIDVKKILPEHVRKMIFARDTGKEVSLVL